MSFVGWLGAEMEVVNGMYTGQCHGRWSHVERCWSTSRVRGDTLMAPDHTAFQMSRDAGALPEFEVIH